MKLFVLLLAICMVLGLNEVRAQETIEVTPSDSEAIAAELQKESESPQHDSRTKKYLQKVATLFKNAKSSVEVEVKKLNPDCENCTSEQKTKSFFARLGRTLGKGAAWISTNTAKPFMATAGFIKGSVEKGDKNQDIVALYKFFLNHQEDFDQLYLEAGTPEEMLELMLAKMEEIMEMKSRIIMKDFLAHLGVNKEIPEDLSTFELTPEEIAAIDQSKIDPAFINSHPEFQEVKPLVGEMTKQELEDLVVSGYFNKAISFENYKATLPSIPELVATVVGQIYVPKIALGVISKTVASLYVTPVVIADIGTGISTAICLQKDTQDKFENDKDLKQFCSYVTNKTGYELMKSRAKGYVAGKKFHEKVAAKIRRIKEKRAEKKRQKEELH